MFGPQMLGLLPRPIYDPRSTGGRQASVRMSGRKYKTAEDMHHCPSSARPYAQTVLMKAECKLDPHLRTEFTQEAFK